MMEQKRIALIKQNRVIVCLVEQVGKQSRDRRAQLDRKTDKTVRSQKRLQDFEADLEVAEKSSVCAGSWNKNSPAAVCRFKR
jgi:hypothetical protein